MSSRTHRTRLARRVAGGSALSYQQALTLVSTLAREGKLPPKVDGTNADTALAVVLHHADNPAADPDPDSTGAPAAGFAARQLLSNARGAGAGDVLFDLGADRAPRVRMRVDGILLPVSPPIEAGDEIAALDDLTAHIEEHLTPTSSGEDWCEYRGLLPLNDGETELVRAAVSDHDGRRTVVVRFIQQLRLSLDELGIRPAGLEQVRAVLTGPGLVVVSGPAGAGKSLTVESMTGAAPWENVVVVDEIRRVEDVLEALAAVDAGALVLTTMHARNGASVAERLRRLLNDDELEERVAAALRLVVSQVLVRRACPEGPPGHDGDEPRPVSQRCACLNAGFVGRAGVFEVLVASSTSLAGVGATPPVVSMRDSGRDLVESGVTTPEELARVI